MAQYHWTETERDGCRTKILSKRDGAVGSIVMYCSVEGLYKERSISCLKYFFAYFANRPTYHIVQ